MLCWLFFDFLLRPFRCISHSSGERSSTYFQSFSAFPKLLPLKKIVNRLNYMPSSCLLDCCWKTLSLAKVCREIRRLLVTVVRPTANRISVRRKREGEAETRPMHASERDNGGRANTSAYLERRGGLRRTATGLPPGEGHVLSKKGVDCRTFGACMISLVYVVHGILLTSLTRKLQKNEVNFLWRRDQTEVNKRDDKFCPERCLFFFPFAFRSVPGGATGQRTGRAKRPNGQQRQKGHLWLCSQARGADSQRDRAKKIVEKTKTISHSM